MKLKNGSYACSLTVADDLNVISQVPCPYAADTIRYAVKLYFKYCRKLNRECTSESWHYRIAKGKAKRKNSFSYLIPAVLMELPGAWVRVSGIIDSVGVDVRKVEILQEYPGLSNES